MLVDEIRIVDEICYVLVDTICYSATFVDYDFLCNGIRDEVCYEIV